MEPYRQSNGLEAAAIVYSTSLRGLSLSKNDQKKIKIKHRMRPKLDDDAN
jgi:hypothetical protein